VNKKRNLFFILIPLIILFFLVSLEISYAKGLDINYKTYQFLSSYEYNINKKIAKTGLAIASFNKSQAIPPVTYDEQIGITFSRGSTFLKWNITAVSQNESYGYGPAYLLNGLTDSGYWYQVGLAYNWPFVSGGYAEGFYLIYEVWDSTGKSIFPSSGAGLIPFSGRINSNDTVEIRLYFSGSNITMEGYDWNTTAIARISYLAYGTKFVGFEDGNYFIADKNGYFTGLMTEQYHVAIFLEDMKPVLYHSKVNILQRVWLWADEFNANTNEIVFAKAKFFDLSENPSAFYYYSTKYGTNQFVAGNRSGYSSYITGSEGIAVVNLSYKIIGGGTGYSSPFIEIFANNKKINYTLNDFPYGYVFPLNSKWKVDELLAGSSDKERWITNVANGTFNTTFQNLEIKYYHQYKVFIETRIAGGGNYIEPEINYTFFGIPSNSKTNTTLWVDANTSYFLPLLLKNSNDKERWITMQNNGTIKSYLNITVFYYHQYKVRFIYHISGGGENYSQPFVSYYYFGEIKSVKANTTDVWADAGKEFTYQEQLYGLNNKERWVAKANKGVIKSSEDIEITYIHQFFIEIKVNYQQAGTINATSGWYDAYTQLMLSATSNQGWKFMGWIGYGKGSYNGTGIAKIIIYGPISELGIFYAEVKIIISGQGYVIFSNENTSGKLDNGQHVIYVAPNETLHLRAEESYLFFNFQGWKIGNQQMLTDKSIDLNIEGPLTIEAVFGFSIIFYLIILISAIGIMVILIYYKFLRK
jgi:hypothetical protein